jgi:ElaB/YqjD/DUF883 family membrane-anchored ribosome-binding protein
MSRRSESEDVMDESTSAIADITKKADDAVRDTARTYLTRFGVKIDLEKIEKSIRHKPLRSAGIATGAGFVIGGGMTTRPGVALLAFFSWIAAKDAATHLLTCMLRARAH